MLEDITPLFNLFYSQIKREAASTSCCRKRTNKQLEIDKKREYL